MCNVINIIFLRDAFIVNQREWLRFFLVRSKTGYFDQFHFLPSPRLAILSRNCVAVVTDAVAAAYVLACTTTPRVCIGNFSEQMLYHNAGRRMAYYWSVFECEPEDWTCLQKLSYKRDTWKVFHPCGFEYVLAEAKGDWSVFRSMDTDNPGYVSWHAYCKLALRRTLCHSEDIFWLFYPLRCDAFGDALQDCWKCCIFSHIRCRCDCLVGC